jgi:hypothetical protein
MCLDFSIYKKQKKIFKNKYILSIVIMYSILTEVYQKNLTETKSMKKNQIFMIAILVIIAVLSSCKKEETIVPSSNPTISEADRLAIWNLSDTRSVFKSGENPTAQWSPYPFEKFVVWDQESEAFYRRYFVIYEDLPYTVYDKVDLDSNGNWFVLEEQAKIFTEKLPDMEFVKITSNKSDMYQFGNFIHVTIPPKFVEGKWIGNLSYTTHVYKNMELLFDETILSSEIGSLAAFAQWNVGQMELNLHFVLPTAPNAILWVSIIAPDYSRLNIYWEDNKGQRGSTLVMEPNSVPTVQIYANSINDIKNIKVVPQYFNGISWVDDWSYLDKTYQIFNYLPNEYLVEFETNL